MERRQSERITVNLRAERISGNKNSSLFIENLSESGIYLITASAKNQREFVPGTALNLKLKLSAGETINLDCNVKWSYSNLPEDLTNSVGLEIIDPPHKYLQFIKTLY